jgi:acetoin utilization deacetylase AcuC-like enzyme
VAGGASAAYALCRPPGHHACPGAYGGSCYLNNAAVAAEALRRAGADRAG